MNDKTHPFVCFDLKEPNRHREVTQVLDMMLLDIDYHIYEKKRLAMAIVLYSILRAFDVVPITYMEPPYNKRKFMPTFKKALQDLDKALNDIPDRV